jgi:hypothetical protein
MSFTFVIPDDEVKEYRKWLKKHNKVCQQKDVGAIGGRFTFSFTPTAIGCGVIIKCACGKEIDLSHSETW